MIKQLYRFLHPKFQNLHLEYKVDFKPRYGHGKPAHPELLEIIQKNDKEYKHLLEQILLCSEELFKIKDSKVEKDPLLPTWNNGFFPGLDTIALYTIIKEYKPKKYIEIGSGNSTKIAYKARSEQAIDMQIISIDPQPRVSIDKLSDKVIRRPFENLKIDDIDIINELEPNDILFIDNSHRILPNSDSMVFYLEVLPRLKKGVIVHIHDIYLPFDYPQFMCDRYYSEQYGLAFFLLANSTRYKTIMPNYYISEKKELAKIIDPIWQHENTKNVEKHGGSFWLQIN